MELGVRAMENGDMEKKMNEVIKTYHGTFKTELLRTQIKLSRRPCSHEAEAVEVLHEET